MTTKRRSRDGRSAQGRSVSDQTLPGPMRVTASISEGVCVEHVMDQKQTDLVEKKEKTKFFGI